MAQNINNLPVGAKIKFGKYSALESNTTGHPIPWIIVGKNNQGAYDYLPSRTVILLCEKVIWTGDFDEEEASNPNNDRRVYGNNRYKVSNVSQWLNSDAPAGQWYEPQHEYDEQSAYYKNKRGFLNLFSDGEKAQILTVNVPSNVPSVEGGGYEYVSQKVFLPTTGDVGYFGDNIPLETGRWEYFEDDTHSRNAQPWEHYNEDMYHTPTASGFVTYWLRTPSPTQNGYVYYIHNDGSGDALTAPACHGRGLRPALCLSYNTSVSDTVDEDGCYVIVENTAPPSPININLPSTIRGDGLNTISWSQVTDPDGDSIYYELECTYSGYSGFSLIYQGTATSYTHLVDGSRNSIQYRVRALDGRGRYSDYTTSASVNIVDKLPPVISGTDTDLGEKIDGFSQEYSITDEDSTSVIVTETIDDVLIRSYSVTLGATNTFSVTGETWLKLTNGIHTMIITATDTEGCTTTRRYVFTKNVTSLLIQTNPMHIDYMPTRISLNVTRSIPTESKFKIEVCNNANDIEPVWEDATETITDGKVYLFENTSKTADAWAVSVKITVDRNGAEGSCYISSIGGAFE